MHAGCPQINVIYPEGFIFYFLFLSLVILPEFLVADASLKRTLDSSTTAPPSLRRSTLYTCTSSTPARMGRKEIKVRAHRHHQQG